MLQHNCAELKSQQCFDTIKKDGNSWILTLITPFGWDNVEADTIIKYCPFCGTELK